MTRSHNREIGKLLEKLEDRAEQQRSVRTVAVGEADDEEIELLTRASRKRLAGEERTPDEQRALDRVAAIGPA